MQHKKISLITYKQGNGSQGLIPQSRRTVWGTVGDVGVTTKLTALTAGKAADLQLTVLRSEYSGETHAEVNGKIYRIASTGASDNPLKIKLILEGRV